jgi:hypothetical protein
VKRAGVHRIQIHASAEHQASIPPSGCFVRAADLLPERDDDGQSYPEKERI